MRKYRQRELCALVLLGVAEDYTNKPSEYIYTLRRLEKVGYSSGVYGINGGLDERICENGNIRELKCEY